MGGPRLIGPRRPSGAFYKKRPATKKPRASKAVSKPVKAAIERILNKNIETKFVVSSVVNSMLYNTVRSKMITSGTATFQNLRTCMPIIVNSGTASNDLIGTRAKIVSLKTYLHFNLDTGNSTSNDVMIKVFFLHSKNAKNFTVATAGLPAGNLLRTGAASEEDWVPAAGVDMRLLAQLPVNKQAWTGTTKTFRLSKNAGTINGGTAVPILSSGNASYTFTYDWKAAKKTLKYDESDGSNYPENFLPLIAAVAWYPDGTSVGPQDSTMPVFVTLSNHLYYKDA